MVDLTDRRGVQDFLFSSMKRYSERERIVLATRTALRAFAFFPEESAEHSRQELSRSHLLSLRILSTMLSWVLHPENEAELRAAADASAQGGAITDAHYTALAAADSYTSNYAADSIDCSIFLVDRMPTQTQMWRAFKQDLREVDARIPSAQTRADRVMSLAVAPLWPDGIPTSADHDWSTLAHSLRESDESWTYWIDWYETILSGGPRNEALELDICLIPDADWKHEDNPLHVNRIIQGLVEKHRPEPSSESEPAEALPEQNVHGARWTVAGDRISIAPGLPEIGDHAEALQPLAAEALEELIEALGQSNQFKRLSDKAAKALGIAKLSTDDANKQAVALWSCSVWMGEFAERDDAVRLNPKAFADALEEDQRVALNAAVRQTAAYARQFRTALELDAEDASFNRRDFRLEAHSRIVTVAHEEELIDDDSKETVETMVEAARGDAVQADKARSVLSPTVRNLLIATVVILSPIGETVKVVVRDAAEGFSEGMTLKDRGRRLGEKAGDAIDEVLQGAPPDLRQGLAPLRAPRPIKKP